MPETSWKILSAVDKGKQSSCTESPHPVPWRRGLQVLEDVVDDAEPLKRVEDKRREWRRHWHRGTRAQGR